MSGSQQHDPAGPGVPFVPLEALGAPGAVIVDLRAPVEFDDDHAPGAINVPLFENETRSFVGLLYKQFSPEAAFNEARAAVMERAVDMVRAIASAAGEELPLDDAPALVQRMTEGGMARLEGDLEPLLLDAPPERPVILSCARGGLRSRSVVALLRALGLTRVVGLEGGYRALRRRTMDALEAWSPPPRVISLRGLTGVGKTLVLRELERLRPGLTVDLEGLAGHRSSLLGMVGLVQSSQKSFESRLAARLAEGFPHGVMVMEGESRKVGDAVIPRAVWEALQGATNLKLTAGVPRRVQVLRDDYMAVTEDLPRLRTQLEAVAARMPQAPDLAGMFDAGRIDALVELLLEDYYDPLYLRSESGKVYAGTVDTECEERAAREILELIDGSRP